MSSSAFSRLHGLFSKSPKHISTSTAAATLAAVFSPSATKETTPTSPVSARSKIQKLVKSFKNNSRSPQFRHRQDRYQAAVRRLTAGKNYSAIESILEYQKKYKDSMADEGFGIRLITLYGKAGMFDHAYKMFDELPQYNCPRTVKSFNALLSACVKSKKLDSLIELFHELPNKLGIEPDVISYNVVIKGFCKVGDFDSAVKVIEKMEESEIRPDTASYNTVVEAYYQENNLDEAEKLWQRMVEKDVVADVRTYNAKLRNLFQNEQVQEALELVEKMVNEDVKPNNYTYNAVIKGCVRNGNLEEAKIWREKMVGDGCRPDHVTYYMLVSYACEVGDIDFAFELCKQSVKSQVNVYRSLMQHVVDELIKRSKIVEANELVSLASSSKKHGYTLTLPMTTL